MFDIILIPGCALPLPIDLDSSAWGCDGDITGSKVGDYVSCSYRCGQGGTAGVSQCKGTEWDPDISSVLDCDYKTGGEMFIQICAINIDKHSCRSLLLFQRPR